MGDVTRAIADLIIALGFFGALAILLGLLDRVCYWIYWRKRK